MPPSPYLLWVNSRPTKATDEQWVEWYTKEHVPDLVGHGASTRATFYRETFDLPGSSKEQGKEHRLYLALYQTNFEEPLKSKEYLGIRTTSEILPGKQIMGAGEFNARNYELIQDYDPDSIGEVPPNSILTVEMEPLDEADFEAWYREEHLDALHKVPGYRRSQRYKLGPPVPKLTQGDPPRYLAVHELDDVKTFSGSEYPEVSSQWTKRQVGEAKAFTLRGWEKVDAVGF